VKANYDLIADSWNRARTTLPPLDEALFSAFMQRLPPAARVLDIGCGTGRPIAAMLAAMGCRVRGIDRSGALLAHARLNVPLASFEQGEIEDYQIAAQWDGVVLWDVIFHIPRARHRGILTDIFAALAPGGMLVLTSGGSIDDPGPFTDMMFGVDFFYDALPRQALVDLCLTLGYTLESQVMLNQPDGGRDKGRLGLLLARSSP
jgi:SAM-dependent methyltransferase